MGITLLKDVLEEYAAFVFTVEGMKSKLALKSLM